MRVFTIILSIFFLGLNFVPCNDNSITTEDSQVLIEMDQNANNHQHNTTGDSCSPFCQCHCCHVHVTQFNIANFQPITPEIPTVEFIHFNGIGKEISKQLLQPPRV